MNDTMHYIPAKPPLHYRILRWSTALNTPHHTIALIHSHTDVQIAFIHTLHMHTPGLVTTGWVTAARYTISVYNQPPGQLSLPSVQVGYIEAGARWGSFTCIGYVIPYGRWHPVARRCVYRLTFNIVQCSVWWTCRRRCCTGWGHWQSVTLHCG